ncbi:MAG: metallophosphoesterase [Prolixibacteraceae bacterium]|nr:metallophosphoesterase [Prolixibacteraceae bacterium]
MRLFVMIFLAWVCTWISSGLHASNNERYTFLVAGHAYGAHSGTNKGLHPPLLQKLSTYSHDSIFSIFLTGDIVNYSTAESWAQVSGELDSLGLKAFYVMGNHDNNAIGKQVFQQMHGGTFYAFEQYGDLFIVLNSTLIDRSISPDQIDFLQHKLNSTVDSIRNIFIFFHEVLWTSQENYVDLRVNSRSRYAQMKEYSNYWDAVHPLLQQTGKNVFVFAGDVAGNEDAISLFYEQRGRVRLIASGMGEVFDENFLKVIVSADSISIVPVPLDTQVEMYPIQTYALPEAPDTIMGPDYVEPGSYGIEYLVPEHAFTAMVHWSFNGNLSGTNNQQQVLVDFYNNFTGGIIGAAYERDGYGTGPVKEMKVMIPIANALDVDNYRAYSLNVWDNVLIISTSKNTPENCRIKIYRMNGTCILNQYYFPDEMLSKIEVPLHVVEPGLYLLSLQLGMNSYFERIILH